MSCPVLSCRNIQSRNGRIRSLKSRSWTHYWVWILIRKLFSMLITAGDWQKLASHSWLEWYVLWFTHFGLTGGESEGGVVQSLTALLNADSNVVFQIIISKPIIASFQKQGLVSQNIIPKPDVYWKIVISLSARSTSAAKRLTFSMSKFCTIGRLGHGLSERYWAQTVAIKIKNAKYFSKHFMLRFFHCRAETEWTWTLSALQRLEALVNMLYADAHFNIAVNKLYQWKHRITGKLLR